jgi:hypothetical protein
MAPACLQRLLFASPKQTLRGHTAAAASLLAAAPELSATVDAFGTCADALLAAHTSAEEGAPHHWALRAAEGTEPTRTGAEASSSGGWPAAEVLFPGWPNDESASRRLRCEFTEVTMATARRLSASTPVMGPSSADSTDLT